VFAKVLTAIIAVLAVAILAPAAVAADRKPVSAKVVSGATGLATQDRTVATQERAFATQDCADADLAPATENLNRVRAAVLCLHNQERARHGLPALRENDRLRRAALGHSRAMVSSRFFEHTTPAGISMTDRILRSRYVGRNQGWTLGENLAWGTGSMATPRSAVQSWLKSPGHRANLLKRSYRELGVGVVIGVPVSDAAGATYTVDFGVRR